MSQHNKSAGHLKKLESTENTVPTSTSTSFVDCGGANIKLEIKEETLDEDPLSINMEAENVKKTLNQEKEEEIEEKDCIDIIDHKI